MKNDEILHLATISNKYEFVFFEKDEWFAFINQILIWTLYRLDNSVAVAAEHLTAYVRRNVHAFKKHKIPHF